jgi:hypothetical protein
MWVVAVLNADERETLWCKVGAAGSGESERAVLAWARAAAAKRGVQSGCRWRVVEGGAVDALVSLAGLIRGK